MNKLNKPIFILGSHKSGTTLLKNLLDGHTELFAIPSETHFFQYSGHWVDYALRENTNLRKTLTEQEAGLSQFFLYENTIKDPYGPGDMDGCYDEEKFKQSMSRNKASTQKQLFCNYIHALHQSLTGNKLLPTKRIVEKSVENSDYAMLLKKWYPDAKFVHIVRNPYATITAIRKMKSSQGYPFLGPIINSAHNSLYSLYRNVAVISDYMVVGYEDLLRNPETIMRNIAKHLDIAYNSDLLKPTLFGNHWHGNSTSEQKFTTISTAPIKNWETEITDIEVALVNRYLSPVLDTYNYERKKQKHNNLWHRILNENMKNYCLNRMLLQSQTRDLF